MGTPGPSPSVDLSDVLQVFEGREDQYEPLTATEAAAKLDCTRRTAHKKLSALSDRGELASKKAGSRSRVWWRPDPAVEGADSDGRSLKELQFDELADQVSEYAIFVLDDEGYIETWNAGAERIKGYSEQAIVGEHLATFYTEEDRAKNLPSRNLRAAAELGYIEDEGWRVRDDGSRFWANITLTTIRNDDGDLVGYIKVTRDMSERRRYEEELRERRDELNELNRINAIIREVDQALINAESRDQLEAAVCDRLAADPYLAAWMGDLDHADGGLRPRYETVFDPSIERAIADADTQLIEAELAETAMTSGMPQVTLRADVDDRFSHWTTLRADTVPSAVVVLPLQSAFVDFGVLVVYATDGDAFDDRKLDVLAQLGDTISDTLASLRHVQRERRLTALHRATRDLVDSTDADSLATTIAETVTDVLDFQDAHVYRFQTDDNTLEPIASVTRDPDVSIQLPVLSASDDDAIWSVFLDGRTQTFEGEETVLAGYGQSVGRTELVVPLSEHGVLVTGADPDRDIDPDDRNLVDLVATTAEASFDRLETEANLRERDTILQKQNQRLQRLNQVNTLIREVDQALVQASSYGEIQRVVCERLTTPDRFRFAWIGETQTDPNVLSPAATGGVATDYLDAIDLSSESQEPAVLAARTGTVQVVENVAANLRVAQWRSEAFSREFQSCLAVPLTYGDVTYGVLAVYGDRPGTFGDIEESVFEELGTTIGNAIHAVETKQALQSDRTVEVEFRLETDGVTPLLPLARAVEAELTYEGSVPVSDENERVFFLTTAPKPDVLSAAADLTDVIDVNAVSEREDTTLYELGVTGDSLAAVLASKNTRLRSLTADPDGATLLVDIPVSADVGDVIDWFLDAHPGAVFVARRERDREMEGGQQIHRRVTETLTDRQYEVLKTAYISGFFDSPRQSSGRDVAETLGVSQPTITEHLRAAQRRLLDELFED